MLDEFGENDDLTRFRRPTMIDWLPDGTFFVADGYGNTRVVKFDKTGKALLKWGSRGTGPGQFNTPHGIAVGGSPPRVFVSDRGNRRIQVFDTNGKFLEEWPGIAPHSMLMSADEHVWAVDSLTDRIVKFDLSGHVEFSFGQFGTRPGYTGRRIKSRRIRTGICISRKCLADARRSTVQSRMRIRPGSCGAVADADGERANQSRGTP
jgi:DNA-binding beta-propeller fold protein YncE